MHSPPTPATGTATLDTVSRRDAAAMVRDALDAATRLGCTVEAPGPIDEIDLRDATLRADHPSAASASAAPAVAPAAGGSAPTDTAPPRPARPARGRRARGGALVRVRALVPTAELVALERDATAIDARMTHTDEPTPEDHPDGPRSRVTLELAASAADSAMRVLGSVSTGTPTIEIVTARDLADRGR